ncbi:carboxylic ester hydrolase [Elysia marginata]|uniref:Carboxylic ester hydrolase n=1 Tax=Elysia marginata TaxID=1093978 RepID=A0AAV4GI73_9GAST|nr:carboxylic ester hydrolase [Elysia marginata]
MDLFYLFDFPAELGPYLSFYADLYTPRSASIPGIYGDVLTSFAKSSVTGDNANPPPITTASGVWPNYGVAEQKYLAISTEPQVRRHPYAQRVALWTEFLPKLSAQSSYFSSPGRAAYE